MNPTHLALREAQRRCLQAIEDTFENFRNDVTTKPDACDKQTLEQLKTAPAGTVAKPTIYVWKNSQLREPFYAAYIKYNRKDLLIVKPSWLLGSDWFGQLYSGLVIDHNTRLTEAEWLSIANIKSRVR